MREVDILIFLVACVKLSAGSRCNSDEFDCHGIFATCLPRWEVCDGKKDCRNGLDENFCDCRTDSYCGDGEYCEKLFPMPGSRCVKHAECPAGMTRSGKRCVDVDECSTKTHNCTTEQFCVNTRGSFYCQCKHGLMNKNGLCDDIDECTLGYCLSPGICNNTRGSYSCTCPPLYVPLKVKGDRGQIVDSCTATDFCVSNDCQSPYECRNDGNGSYECVCPQRRYLERNGTCEDVDECQGQNFCQRATNNVKCENLEGSYACRCGLDNFSKAVKVDDIVVEVCRGTSTCKQDVNCKPNETCIQGMCFCQEGFNFNTTSGSCQDVDECSLGFHDCPSRLSCKNEVGGFVCVCPAGYRETASTESTTSTYGTVGCVDIDECADDEHRCQFDCFNTPGSYKCSCKPGYVLDIDDKLCLPLGEPSDLIVSRFGRFFNTKVNFNGSDLTFVPMPTTCKVMASTIFTYYQSRSEIYFAAIDNSSIYRTKINESCHLIVEGRSDISHIEVDWGYGKLYWAENNAVMVSELNGAHQKTLLKLNESLQSLVVNPFDGWMTISYTSGKAERVGLDGTYRSQIFSDVIVKNVVYDVEEQNILLETPSLLLLCPQGATSTGTCTPLPIAQTNGSRLMDMFVDFILFETGNLTIEVISRNGRRKLQLPLDRSFTFKSVHGRLVHEFKQPPVSHKCSSVCTHLCTNSPTIMRYSCLCPDSIGENDCTPIVSSDLGENALLVSQSSSSSTVLILGILLFIAGAILTTYGCYLTWRAKKSIASQKSTLCARFSAINEPPVVTTVENIYESVNQLAARLVNNEVPPDVCCTAANFQIR